MYYRAAVSTHSSLGVLLVFIDRPTYIVFILLVLEQINICICLRFIRDCIVSLYVAHRLCFCESMSAPAAENLNSIDVKTINRSCHFQVQGSKVKVTRFHEALSQNLQLCMNEWP